MQIHQKNLNPLLLKVILSGLFSIFCLTLLMAQGETSDVAMALKANLMLSEQLGMLGPVAISPYWGLFLASASSVFGIGDNEYLMTHPMLGNWVVFVLFLVVAVLTSIPNITKYSKALGVAANYLEDNTAIVIVVLTIFLPTLHGMVAEPIPPNGEFGLLGTSFYSLLLMAFSAIYMFIVTTVRLFFEIMAFVTPIPFVDTITEILKKIASLVMMGVYFVSPEIALGISLLLLIVAIFFFSKATTSINYFKQFYMKPIWGWVTGKRPTVLDEGIAKRINKPDIEYAIPVWPLEPFGKIKKKKKAWLVKETEGRIYLYQMKKLAGSIQEDINGKPTLKKDFNYFEITAEKENPILKIRMSRDFFNYKDEIVSVFDFEDEDGLDNARDGNGSWWSKIKTYFHSTQLAEDSEIMA